MQCTAPFASFGAVCVIFYLASRYTRPEGPWQRRHRYLSNGGRIFLLNHNPVSDRHNHGQRPSIKVLVTGHSKASLLLVPRSAKERRTREKKTKEINRGKCILGRARCALLSFVVLAVLLPSLLLPRNQRDHPAHPRVPQGQHYRSSPHIIEHCPHGWCSGPPDLPPPG